MMKPLEIAGGKDRPSVLLDADNNKYEITGNSYPENCWEYYLPAINWLEQLLTRPPSEMYFKFHLGYISSSTILSLFQLFVNLQELSRLGTSVTIEWKYDEDDFEIRKQGERFAANSGINFVFIPTGLSD